MSIYVEGKLPAHRLALADAANAAAESLAEDGATIDYVGVRHDEVPDKPQDQDS